MANTRKATREKPCNGEKTSLSLLDALRDNQQDGWSRLDQLYRPLVCYWCKTSGVNAADVADLRQEVFLVASTSLEKFTHRGEGSFRAWLREITRRLILDHFRKRRSQPCAEGGTDACLRLREHPDLLPLDEEDPSAEVAALYHRCLNLIRSDFPPHYFDVFCRHFIAERPLAEVAQEVGISTALARQAISRIRKRLNEVLGDEPGSEEPANG